MIVLVKILRKYAMMFFLISTSVVLRAQTSSVGGVALTVSSSGMTKEDAVKNALRSAIEQTYGAFVSANTTILEDKLIEDEIVTVAAGNIESYEEVSSVEKPGGGYFVTLNAVVSLPKLISYAQSKGAETEFAGSTFGMNVRLKELNRQSERKVLENLLIQVEELMPVSYNLSMAIQGPFVGSFDALKARCKSFKFDSPERFAWSLTQSYGDDEGALWEQKLLNWVKSVDDSYIMQFVVNISPKSGIGSVQHLIRHTLLSLSISEQEANEYREMNMPVSKWRFNGELFSLRNDQQFINSCRFKLIEIQNEYFRGISFIDNMGVESAPGKYIFTDVRYKEDKLPRFGPDPMYGYTIETGTGLLNPFYEIFGHMEYFSSPDYLDDGYRRYNDAETYSSLSVGSSTLLFSFLMPKNEIAKYSNFKVEIRNE